MHAMRSIPWWPARCAAWARWAGLIFSTGLKLLPALRRNVLGAPTAFALAALMFGCIALLRVPLLWMLTGLGGLACALAWRRLEP